jgi:hypothetical protein
MGCGSAAMHARGAAGGVRNVEGRHSGVMSSVQRAGGALRRAWGVAPTTGNGVSAMSPERRAQVLAGYDATTVLEAASTVLADIENGRFSAVAARLPRSDQRTLAGWLQRATREGATVASTPVHPLAVLAATTLALGQSAMGPRSDSIRDDLASRLTTVGLRFNVDVLEGPTTGDDHIVSMAISKSPLVANESPHR